MKNILNHNGTSQLLLANVDDGTNSIVINGEELDPTYWVGENSYVVLIDGTPIGIRQISSNSGNIMMRKVSGHVNEYQLVRQSDALCYSHVGQIIHSTKLATLEDVQAIYGSDTTWIQHTGYILRGASSGVTADSAAKDGGEDTHTLTINEMPSHTHTQNAHSHTTREPWHNGSASGTTLYGIPWVTNSSAMYNTIGNETGTFSGVSVLNATATNQNTGGGAAHNNMQSYKNVYIWERVS